MVVSFSLFCSKQHLNCVFRILFAFTCFYNLLQLAATLNLLHVLLVLLWVLPCRPGAFVLLRADCLTHRFSSRGGMPRIHRIWNEYGRMAAGLRQDVKNCLSRIGRLGRLGRGTAWDSIKWNRNCFQIISSPVSLGHLQSPVLGKIQGFSA